MDENYYLDILKRTNIKTLIKNLEKISNEDIYCEYFLKTDQKAEMLYMLLYYDIAFIASDKRIMLTVLGNSFFQKLMYKYS